MLLLHSALYGECDADRCPEPHRHATSSSRILHDAGEAMMRATIRSAALREMLVEHQRRVQDDVYAVLRDSRASLAQRRGSW